MKDSLGRKKKIALLRAWSGAQLIMIDLNRHVHGDPPEHLDAIKALKLAEDVCKQLSSIAATIDGDL